VPPSPQEREREHAHTATRWGVAAHLKELAMMDRRARLLSVIETLKGVRQQFDSTSLNYDILTDCIKRLTDIRNVTDR
jgi:hypothetical protein